MYASLFFPGKDQKENFLTQKAHYKHSGHQDATHLSNLCLAGKILKICKKFKM